MIGRADERALIGRLLAEARSGRSGALVLVGEPGVGKSVLLEHAVELAGGMRVLQATGVETEVDLTFAGLDQLFLGRVRLLPEASQTLLLVAAADDTADPAVVFRAAAELGVGPEALEAAERAGLTKVDGVGRVVFRHPLVRAAVYQGATFGGRMAAHRALASAGRRRPCRAAGVALGRDGDRSGRRHCAPPGNVPVPSWRPAMSLRPIRPGQWTRRNGRYWPAMSMLSNAQTSTLSSACCSRARCSGSMPTAVVPLPGSRLPLASDVVPLYHDQGVVLRTYKLGEADRIVVLLTKGHGKVRAVAKGIRKTKSRFGGRLEPPSHVRLLLYEGRELDIVSQAETLDHFRAIRDDLDRLGHAISLLEATDQVSLEREPNGQLYDMLVGALRTLADRQAPLVVPAFFLKLLALEGLRPQVEGCLVCGSDGPLVSWAIAEGGLCCSAHRQGPAVSAEAVTTLRHILGGRLATALDESRSPVVAEVDHLATRALEHHLERRLRSVTTLHRS